MGRRAALILCLGLATWLLLWWTGRAGPWTTAAVGAGVALLLLVNLWAAPRRPGSAGPHHPEAEAPRERAASVPEYLSHRPNAVRPDYNTLPDVWPPHPPRVIKPAPQPIRRESMPEPAPPQDPPAAEPAPSRMPPPVPPPLFGRPGSRPIVAGMEHTVGSRWLRAVREDEPGAAGTGSPVEGVRTEGDAEGGAGTEIAIAADAGADVVVQPEASDSVRREVTGGVHPEASGGALLEATADTNGEAGAGDGDGAAAQADDAPLAATAAGADEEVAATAPPEADAAPPEAVAAPPEAPASAPPSRLQLPGLTEAERAALGLLEPEAGPEPRPDPGATPDTSYHLPSLDLLPLPETERGLSDDEILERASLLERTLASFGVEATVVDFAFGPAVTRYELQPGPGVRVNKFTALADDIALALAATDVRVEAPIPGKSAVGIEVPNKERLPVPLREVLQSPEFLASTSKLTVALGKDNSGRPVVGDLARMPHLLIAGATGSGKSVCMNTLICSLLYKARPDEVKMLMIDPKMVELSIYNGIPHLTAPVITDVRRAAGYLKGAVKEMEARYELFAALGVRNIEQYNRLAAADPGTDPDNPRRPLPYIVIFIDELADLMMVAPADVEDAICRLAQMARACGIHLVIATQSPRVDVITGLIKANIPSRIAFAVSSQVDSRVILDTAGAERLLGRGDMLYHPAGLSKPVRAQGAYISEASVERLVQFVKAQGRPEYTAQEVPLENGGRRGRNGGQSAQDAPPAPSAVDEALPEAARIIIEHGHASVSLLQRRLRCNYTKAARLIDELEAMGLIGPHQGSKPREVLATMATWQELFGGRREEQ